MEKKEELEIIELKKEIVEVGEKNMDRERLRRYIFLRRKQKESRKTEHNEVLLKQQPLLNNFSILWGFIPFIIIILIAVAIMSIKPGDIKNDCIIPTDSPDCLEGGGGHPLWMD